MAESTEIYDLLILIDATYSMTAYVNSLQKSLPKIISISALTDCFSRIGLLAYRDYSEGSNLIDWSGWITQSGPGSEGEQQDLVSKAKGLWATGGGDFPEATKTGL